MTVKIDMVEGAVLAANATTDITIASFGAVKGAIIIAMSATADNAVSDHAEFSIGFYEPVGAPPFGAPLGQVACGFSSENDVSQTDERRNAKLTRGIYIPSRTGAILAEYSVSAITDGIRLTRQAATTGNCWVRCIFFGGTGLTVGPLFGQDLFTVASPQVSSGYSFAPHLIFAMTAAMPSTSADTADSVFSFGVAGLHNGATLRQYSNNFASEDGTADDFQDHRATLKSGEILAPIGIRGSSPLATVTIEDFTADGFEYSWEDVTSNLVVYGLVIGLNDPMALRLSDSTLTSGATSWVSEAMEADPVFGMISMIDGVTGLGTGYSSVGAISLTALTPSKQFASSFLVDPDGTGSRTLSKQLRTTGPTAWRSLLKGVGGVEQSMTGTLSINGSHQIALSSMTGVPARDTVLWYLAVLGHAENVYKGPDELFSIFNGDDYISAVYQGTNQIY